MLTLLCSKSIRNGLWLPEHWAWDTQLHIEQVCCKSEALAFFFLPYLSVCHVDLKKFETWFRVVAERWT